ERPVKRRRVDDLGHRSKSLSRAASPPWKLAVAEGPSSVVVDGVRKSTRRNALVDTPPPVANKRSSRGTNTEVVSNSGRKKNGALQNGHNITSSPLARQSTRKTRAVDTNTVQATFKTPASRSNPTRASSSKQVSTPAHSRADSSRQKPSPHSSRANPSPSTPKRGPGRPRKVSMASTIEVQSASIQPSPSQAMDNDSPRRGPRLRLRMPTVKVPTRLHVNQIPSARKHESFKEWYESEEFDKGEVRAGILPENAKKEADIRDNILEAAKPGGVLSVEKCEIYDDDPQEEPLKQYGHWSHVVTHAIRLQELMSQEQKRHMGLAKRLAIEAVHSPRRPRTDNEVWNEEYGYAQKRYKQVVKDMHQIWENVRGEVNRQRFEQWEEQQQAEARQDMHNMLDHSKIRLTQQLNREVSNIIEEDGDREKNDDDVNEDDAQNSDDAESDSENMSSEDETEDEDGVDEDEGLSMEELRAKYGSVAGKTIYSQPPDTVEIEELEGSEVEEPEATDDEEQDVGSTPRTPMSDGPEPTEGTERAEAAERDDDEEGEIIALKSSINPADVVMDDVDDALIDEDDDDSIPTESDEDDDTDMDGDSPSDESEEEDVGLAGFFGVKERRNLKASQVGPDDSDAIEVEERKCPESSGLNDTTEATTTNPVQREEINGVHADDTSALSPGAAPPKNKQSVSPSWRLPPEATPPLSHNAPKSDATGDNQSMDEEETVIPLPRTVQPVKTSIPSLLRGTLREYQHHGLDWLAGLYAAETNGILADEMGLGKTIQTISLLAHLAVEKHVWGPHLIVVPTSVMLNWEMEFKKWCPGFRILTYYGDILERQKKRQGWLNDDMWNVVITSYQLILKDAAAFKKRPWTYLILDEAHNIKNFKTQRWQTLLNFRTQRRLLLTGTPLQNNLSELWSLLYFLMPPDSQGKNQFTDLEKWVTALHRPANQILDQGRQALDAQAQKIVNELHEILRPYLLRRLKADVEKQMPAKYEHIVYCRLSKRQRQLYDAYMGRTDTKAILSGGNYLSIINCLMSLRKVCNHPDLFETRQIVTSFAMPRSVIADFEIKDFLVRKRMLEENQWESINLEALNLKPVSNEETSMSRFYRSQRIEAYWPLTDLVERSSKRLTLSDKLVGLSLQSVSTHLQTLSATSQLDRLRSYISINRQRFQKKPIYGSGLLQHLYLNLQDRLVSRHPARPIRRVEDYLNTFTAGRELIPTLEERAEPLNTLVSKFGFVTPAVITCDLGPLNAKLSARGLDQIRSMQPKSAPIPDPYHEARVRLSIAFPDKRLLQYDCGKLQRLDKLLRELQAGGHRALIFTQMTKVLDILEQFLNIHGHRYLRLDGMTKVEQRQALTDRFNNDTRILAFILSSRSGGLGINLTGADTVIFYDLDWNPAMDKQCQDRCHRIGQTRDVHIYRFVSEYTIEANILRKSNQKRLLDDVIIQKGDFTTDYFNKLTYKDALDDGIAEDEEAGAAMDRVLGDVNDLGQVFEKVEDQEDIKAAQVAQKEVVLDDADFDESGNATNATTPKTSIPPTPAAENAPILEDTNPNKLDMDLMRHIDDYMLTTIEREMRHVRFVPPADRRKKKDKKGKD
ncbi:hypothetical protein M501DRAFT_915069, partial [Patellaria atrata CBS 101060]